MNSSSWDDLIQELEEKIGYVFKDKSLVKQAFTHSSYSNEQLLNREPSYERIEFLGDAVLDVVISEYLMDTCPGMPEGELTKSRSHIVCESALARNARQLELGKYMLLGKGEARTGGHDRTSISADVMEGLIGAIYRDSGLDEAKDFIHRFIIEQSGKSNFSDNKSTIQEYVMKRAMGKLWYNLVSVSGPEHDKTFNVNLFLNDEIIGSGSGKSKKSAEQQAAYYALRKIKTEFRNKAHGER